MDRQAWRDFFITVFLLGISFVIAVLSSIAAQQSAIKLAAISAAISLVLAVIGAIYILPRLARRVQMEFIRFAVRTTVTVEGLFFLSLLVVIGFAAWNTANNLLYLILSAMIAFLFAANFISRLSLSDLSIQLRFPDHIFAGEQAKLTLTVTNHKRLIPTFSVMVEPLAEAASSRKGPRTPARKTTHTAAHNGLNGPASESVAATKNADGAIGPSAGYQRKIGGNNGASREPANLGKLAHFILVPPGASAKQRIEHRFEKRGCFPISAFRVSTKFPTGFFKKWRRIQASGEIVVYPKPKPLDDFYHALPMIAGQVSSLARGTGDDLFRIRHYNPSDQMKHIDWKATAKSKQLMVRDHIREDERRLTIVFDTSRPVTAPAKPTKGTDEELAANSDTGTDQKAAQIRFDQCFESAVVMAASLANHFIMEGSDVELITSRREWSVGSASGVDHLYNILKALAALEPDAAQPDGTEAADAGQTRGKKESRLNSRDLPSKRHARNNLNSKSKAGPNGARATQETTLWQALGEVPVLADERRFKVLITSARKGTVPASIWRSAHVVFMEDLVQD